MNRRQAIKIVRKYCYWRPVPLDFKTNLEGVKYMAFEGIRGATVRKAFKVTYGNKYIFAIPAPITGVRIGGING
jgi:hypothetical protein